jgi:hypothetical protein
MDVEPPCHFLHWLLVNKHGPERFITPMNRIAWLEKESFVGLTAHHYLLAELSSMFSTESQQYVPPAEMSPRSKRAVWSTNSGKNRLQIARTLQAGN